MNIEEYLALEMKSANARISEAQQRLEFLVRVEGFVQHLITECIDFSIAIDEGELLTIKIDLTKAVEDGEFSDPERDTESKPEPTPDPEPAEIVVKTEPAQVSGDLVTGPWSDAEIETLISWARAGKTNSELAAHLNRKPKDIANKKYRSGDLIAAASVDSADTSDGCDADANAWPDGLSYPDPWTPQLDLRLFELMHTKNAGAASAGVILKIDKDEVRDRWANCQHQVGGDLNALHDLLKARAGHGG